MSTKTSIKRIALVAVSALGFGSVGVATSSAANLAASYVTSITLAKVTSSPITGSAVNINMGATVVDGTGTVTFTGALTSYPAGGFVSVSATDDATGTSTDAGASDTVTTGALVVTDPAAANGVTATSSVGNGGFTFTPTKTGTYTLTVWNDAGATTDGNIGATEARQTIEITVGSPAGYSTGYSTAYAIDGNGAAAVGTSTTDATAINAIKTAQAANAGTITVSMNDSTNTAMTSGNTLTASITGPGYLKWSTANSSTADSCSATPTYSATVGRTISAQAADAIGTLYVCADGAAGVSTITLTATDAAGTSYALGTKSATFYGSVATLTATAVSKYIADSLSAVNADSDTGGVVASLSAKDSNGNAVELAAGDFTAVTAATLLAQGLDAVTFDAGDSTPYSASTVYVVINPTASKTGAKSLTLTHTSSEKTVDVTFTVSAISAATVTATLDKTEYLPGEKATVTITSKDASGLFSPDATAATDLAGSLSITTNKSVQGTLPTAASFTDGVQTFSFYVPATTGDLSMNVKLASGSAWATALDDTTIALTAKVVSDSTTASDAVDAANEATDAANAATDAANAAAEAADAATAAAQDAQAAVAALATQVASLIAGIKAQITTLTNLVIKIQKKVRA